MASQQLDNLVSTGQLKKEPPARAELQGLISPGRAKLKDAESKALSLESRFDLCYNAAHALSLAALRFQGYRSENRFAVFQCLVHTANLQAPQARILADAHGRRNRAEYEGMMDVTQSEVDSIIRITKLILAYVEKLKT
jgi:hypothetical protein